jgi:hypothetical protein
MTNLAPVPSEGANCAHCGAPLVADQRYCLSCGQPCSPVRLAFLDVLDSERQPQPAGALVPAAPIGYASYADASAGPAWARRYAPLFAVASVLLLALIAGLLLGHWVSQSKGSSGPTIVKVEGLAGAPPASASGTTTPGAGATPTSTSSSGSASSAKSEEAKERAEAKAEEKAEEKAPAKAPPAKALSNTEATKLEKTTGRAKEKELQKITTAPIEVK